MKLHKIEKISSVVPFYSTIFITLITMIELSRRKASIKRKLQFAGVMILTVALVSGVNAFVLSGEMPIINLIVSALLTTITNLLLVEIQKKAYQEQPDDAPNKISKKFEIGVAIALGGWLTVATLITATICFVLLLQFTNPYHGYEDINGTEDTSLAQITQDEIIGTSGSYYAWGTISGSYGNQTDARFDWIYEDYDRIRRSWKYISGVQTLQATKIDTDTLCLNITSEVTKGNMEIVILIDGEYHSSIPVNCTHTVTLEDIAGKTVLVRMGCEAAEIDVVVERTVAE